MHLFSILTLFVFLLPFSWNLEAGDCELERPVPVWAGPSVHGLRADVVKSFVELGGRAYTITKNDSVYVFGFQEGGPYPLLGVGSDNIVERPTLIPQLNGAKIRKLCSGDKHMLALSDEGNVWSWGAFVEGQLGLGILGSQILKILSKKNEFENFNFEKNEATPYPVPQNLSAEEEAILSLAENSLYPTKLKDLSNVVGIECGQVQSFAITSEGEVYAWGRQYGMNTNGTNILPSPTKLAFYNVRQLKVTTDGRYTYALTHQRDVYVWGYGILALAVAKPPVIELGVDEAGHPIRAMSIAATTHYGFILADDGRIFVNHGFKPPAVLATGSLRFKAIYSDRALGSNTLIARSIDDVVYKWHGTSHFSQLKGEFTVDNFDEYGTLISPNKSTFMSFMATPVMPPSNYFDHHQSSSSSISSTTTASACLLRLVVIFVLCSVINL